MSNSSDKSSITSTLSPPHLFSFIQTTGWPNHGHLLVWWVTLTYHLRTLMASNSQMAISPFFYLLLQIQWSHSPTSDASSLVVKYDHIYARDDIEIKRDQEPQLGLNIYSGHQWYQKHKTIWQANMIRANIIHANMIRANMIQANMIQANMIPTKYNPGQICSRTKTK